LARYTDSVCRLCRREGMKLFLKGDRCYTDKCAMEKRAFPPGAHGSSFRSKPSEYSLMLREKQKVKRIYGLLEKQFRKNLTVASGQKGLTGENMLLLLERRLDNTVFRMGFASSRSEARQMVTHGHFTLNGKKATIPSMLVKVNDTIAVREKSKNHPQVKNSLEAAKRKGSTSWIEVDGTKLTGKILAVPNRDELTLPIQEQLIVELYSR